MKQRLRERLVTIGANQDLQGLKGLCSDFSSKAVLSAIPADSAKELLQLSFDLRSNGFQKKILKRHFGGATAKQIEQETFTALKKDSDDALEDLMQRYGIIPVVKAVSYHSVVRVIGVVVRMEESSARELGLRQLVGKMVTKPIWGGTPPEILKKAEDCSSMLATAKNLKCVAKLNPYQFTEIVESDTGSQALALLLVLDQKYWDRNIPDLLKSFTYTQLASVHEKFQCRAELRGDWFNGLATGRYTMSQQARKKLVEWGYSAELLSKYTKVLSNCGEAIASSFLEQCKRGEDLYEAVYLLERVQGSEVIATLRTLGYLDLIAEDIRSQKGTADFYTMMFGCEKKPYLAQLAQPKELTIFKMALNVCQKHPKLINSEREARVLSRLLSLFSGREWEDRRDKAFEESLYLVSDAPELFDSLEKELDHAGKSLLPGQFMELLRELVHYKDIANKLSVDRRNRLVNRANVESSIEPVTSVLSELSQFPPMESKRLDFAVAAFLHRRGYEWILHHGGHTPLSEEYQAQFKSNYSAIVAQIYAFPKVKEEVFQRLEVLVGSKVDLAGILQRLAVDPQVLDKLSEARRCCEGLLCIAIKGGEEPFWAIYKALQWQVTYLDSCDHDKLEEVFDRIAMEAKQEVMTSKKKKQFENLVKKELAAGVRVHAEQT